MKTLASCLLLGLVIITTGMSQSFNLQQMLKEGKLISDQNHAPVPINEKQGVSSNQIVWLKDVNFSTGTIEVDLRGKDIPQRSFLGIAFHGVDTVTYDAIYFRPFNFQSTDRPSEKNSCGSIYQPS